MLYTRKGDNGTTKDFKSKPGERKSKASCQTEALGTLDELNSFLGFVKVKATGSLWTLNGKRPADVVHSIQNDLFTIQAEVAGASKRISADKVTDMEMLIDMAEKEMPPIKTFFVSGGTELTALFDVARTLSRKAERRAIEAVEKGEVVLAPPTLAFLNRLSSLLYALARLTNHKSGIAEISPNYQ